MKKIIPITAVLLIQTGLAAVLQAVPDDLTGKQAKDFTLPVVGEKREITLSGYKDKKIVIVHFWKSR